MIFSHKVRPRLALALGDPAGIGMEVAYKALTAEIAAVAEITLVGNRQWLDASNHKADINFPWLDVPLTAEVLQQIQLGQGSAASGTASFAFLQTAITHTLAGQFDGIVTAPIAKSAWAAAGHHYPGQTELLAEMAGTDKFGMMFVGRSPHTGWQIKMLLATTHIPLAAVSSQLTPQLLTDKLALLMTSLQQDFGIPHPRIHIAGLNPHSGEQGQLGREEVDWLQDWLQAERLRYPHARLEGLLPPDTMWVAPGQAWFGTGQPSVADGYLALYHDQGLIPVKLMAFDRAVNTTIGLPFVRTSPDHGTAFDIAGRDIADATSMREAILLAAELVQQKQAIEILG